MRPFVLALIAVFVPIRNVDTTRDSWEAFTFWGMVIGACCGVIETLRRMSK